MLEDVEYRKTVLAAADAAVARLLREQEIPGAHRELMRRVKLLVGTVLAPGSAFHADGGAVRFAARLVEELSALQVASGLFAGGDNVESPPDSGFTINDVADTLELVRGLDGEGRLAAIATALDEIATRAMPAMVSGGVHTPNHRWELAAALARLHRHRPDARLLRRIEEWLAEGVDIQTDGMYSERSANYAAHVSNPSLTALADILQREDLRTVVARNLTAFLGLIRADATVETVHSRRQDQSDPHFSLAPMLPLYRRYAAETGRGDLAWGAERALAAGIVEPQTALAELLLHPATGALLPQPVAPRVPRRDAWVDSALVVDETEQRSLVVFGGTDYARMRRIRSGLANNPTFLRMAAGHVELTSVRLSRDFFGLGPFRADDLRVESEAIVLTEHVEGRYYQPLSSEHRRERGDYELADEGRYSAAMSFAERTGESIGLDTRVELVPTPDGVDLLVDVDGPRLPWSVELAFAPGGRFEGVTRDGDGYRLTGGLGRYVVGDEAIEFGPGASDAPRGFYRPGEDYDYLGASDALGGPRVYLTGRSPGAVRFSLRATYERA